MVSQPNPWVPMSDPLDIKILGKLNEELNEAGASVSRCLIQGIDEREPETGKINREWLEDELADVAANMEIAMDHFDLDLVRITARKEKKIKFLRGWHKL